MISRLNVADQNSSQTEGSMPARLSSRAFRFACAIASSLSLIFLGVNHPITGSWPSFSDTLIATAVVSLNAGVNTLTFAKGDNYAELDAILIT